jgi:hypothetical protein
VSEVKLALLAAAVLAACAEQEARPEPISLELTKAADWAIAEPAGDPFSAHATERLLCSTAALRDEGGWIEVNTTTCNYSTLVAHFSIGASAGSHITGEVAWATLAAIDPAVATLALALGEQVLWSHEVAIPGEANLVSVDFALPERVAAGSALFFHVRNHGYNSWQLSPLTLHSP